MKNKDLKYIFLVIIMGLFLILIMLFTTYHNYKLYHVQVNKYVIDIASKVKDKYPNTDFSEIVKMLNDKNIPNINDDTLKDYGIENETYILYAMKDSINKSIIMNTVILIVFTTIMIGLALMYFKSRKNKLDKINNQINAILNNDYSLIIDENTEDELSKLRNELYKITIMLKEKADGSLKEKEALKNSLLDISHQMKTPLTSIGIMLDSLKEDKDMEEKTRIDFINSISKQVKWINFLIISLLKISKFDAGVVKFKNEKISIKKLLQEVISNLDIIIDIKNIKINIISNDDTYIIGDYKWQLEALINIVKNCIEHSYDGGVIDINYIDNSLYLKLSIKDYGTGINKDDLKHVFERFYRGANASENSIGIGLALSKKIIEDGNGYIKVNSVLNKYSEFEIKYMKK